MSEANTRQNSTPKKRRPATWEKAFLAALARTGVVSRAAEQAHIDRTTVYLQRKKYADFALAWNDAMEIAADALETEIRRRALEGVQKPIYYKGAKVDTIREYSDTLAMFILKAARPDKYRERFDHSMHSPGSNGLIIKRAEDLSDDELAAIATEPE